MSHAVVNALSPLQKNMALHSHGKDEERKEAQCKRVLRGYESNMVAEPLRSTDCCGDDATGTVSGNDKKDARNFGLNCWCASKKDEESKQIFIKTLMGKTITLNVEGNDGDNNLKGENDKNYDENWPVQGSSPDRPQLCSDRSGSVCFAFT